MPYIVPEQREQLDPAIRQLAYNIEQLPADNQDGAVTYVISRLLVELYAGTRGNFFTMNRANGILSSAAHEFYRRIVGPYEDQKIKNNGDLVAGEWAK